MMRPVSVAMPPVKPDGLAFDRPHATLTLERQLDRRDGVRGAADQPMAGPRGPMSEPVQSPLDPNPATPDIVEPNTTGPMSFSVRTFRGIHP